MSNNKAGGFVFEKPKKRRGPKQKGAGTVVKSRGEITNSGITMKEWQRTPKQLLQEYAQGAKRPRPQYRTARATAGSHRCRVVLPDPKSREKDFVVTTVEEYPNKLQAEHACALLTLFKLEGSRQYERKLPEPYRTSWLQLAGRDTSIASAPVDKNEFSCEHCTKTFKKEHGLKLHEKREHAALLKQLAKEAAAAETTVKANEAKPSSEATSTPKPVVVTAPQTANKVQKRQNVPSKKTSAQPKTISVTSTSKYSSQHEKRLAKEKRDQKHREHKRKLDAKANSNPLVQVFMSDKCRSELEKLIRAKYAEFQGGDVEHDADLVDDSGLKQVRQETIKALLKHGFRSEDAEVGCKTVLEANPGANFDTSAKLEERVLDWLCVHLAEDALPDQFDPRGKQLDVVKRSNNTSGGGKGEEEKVPGHVLRKVSKQLVSGTEGSERDVITLEAAFNSVLSCAGFPPWGTEQEGTVQEDDDYDMEEEEWLALESIFEANVAKREEAMEGNLRRYSLALGAIEGVPGRTQLEFFVPMSNGEKPRYPYISPIIAMANPMVADTLLAAVAMGLHEKAQDLIGCSMMYELWDMAKDMIQNAVQIHGPSGQTSESASATGKHLQAIVYAVDSATSTGVESKSLRELSQDTKQGNRSRKKPAKKRDQVSRNVLNDREMKSRSEELLRTRTEAKSNSKDFQKMMQARSRLPAAKYRNEVVRTIEQNQVTLIVGQTGCGKTTQIPQFLLEDYIDRGVGGKANILCTQPRRLAAVGVAGRVADEQCVPLGDTVGYKIRFDSKATKKTHLCYMTTGILLRRLQHDRDLNGVTHILVDEVHERSVESDFLLSILKSLLARRPGLKLILMSATMNEQVFVKYFPKPNREACPVVRIPGFVHPVEEFYLPDVLTQIGEDIEEDSSSSKKRTRVGQIDYDMIGRLVKHINESNASDYGDGAILIFMPGAFEIARCIRAIEAETRVGRPGNAPDLELLALHGSLSGKDQAKIFRHPPRGKRKVVVSTNVAETSVTVDDCVFVIDSGKMKEMQFDAVNGMSMLVEVWISKASAKQRRGRAGRVRPGKCYKMYTRGKHDSMIPSQIPEIHRTPLEHLVLHILNLGLGPVRRFLSQLIEPPPAAMVDGGIDELKSIGAVTLPAETRGLDQAVKLTALGRNLAVLPMEARLGKMLIFGSLLGCPEQALTVAAGLSVRSPFLRPQDKASEADEAKKKFAFGVAQSDHMCLINAFERWEVQRGEKNKRAFAEEHFLSHQTMSEMRNLRNEYARCLTDMGFRVQNFGETMLAGTSAPTGSAARLEMIQLVKAAICAGMYPNVATVWKPVTEFVDTAGGAVATAPESRKLRFLIQPGENKLDIPAGQMWRKIYDMDRVFLHPSSVNFTEREYISPWVVFREKVLTSKLYLRDCTVISPYSLLLFGGDISVDHAGGTVSVDKWISFRSPARVGVLVKKLRFLIDKLLDAKIVNPALAIEQEKEFDIVSRLLAKNGLG